MCKEMSDREEVEKRKEKKVGVDGFCWSLPFLPSFFTKPYPATSGGDRAAIVTAELSV